MLKVNIHYFMVLIDGINDNDKISNKHLILQLKYLYYITHMLIVYIYSSTLLKGG